MKKHACLLLLAMGLLAIPTEARTQVSPARVTRADSASVLLQAARDFQTEGDWDVAKELFEYIQAHFADTPAGAEALAALQTPSEEGSSRSSRVELQVWSTLYGAWLGVAIPAAFGADGSGAYGAGLLAGAPGGFLAGRALGRSRTLTGGQVRAISFGSLWGTWQGFGWTEVFDWGEKEFCDLDYCYVEDPDSETVFRSMVVGGLAGVATGVLLSRRPISRGAATSANFGALWGTWFGVAGGILADLEDDGLLAATLLAGDGGLVAGAALGSRWNLSRSRARLISIAGVMGGLAGAGLDLLVQPDDEKVAVGIPLATSLAGLIMGTAFTSNREETPASSSASEDLALLEVRDGRIGAGIPAPFFTLLPVDSHRGFTWRPALGLTLFSAQF